MFLTEWVNLPERGEAYYSPSAHFSKLTHSVGHWLVRYCYKHHTEIRCKDKTIFAKYVVSPLLEGGQLLALLVKLIVTIKSVIQACLQMRSLNYSLIFSGLRSSITRLSLLKCCYHPQVLVKLLHMKNINTGEKLNENYLMRNHVQDMCRSKTCDTTA